MPCAFGPASTQPLHPAGGGRVSVLERMALAAKANPHVGREVERLSPKVAMGSHKAELGSRTGRVLVCHFCRRSWGQEEPHCSEAKSCWSEPSTQVAFRSFKHGLHPEWYFRHAQKQPGHIPCLSFAPRIETLCFPLASLSSFFDPKRGILPETHGFSWLSPLTLLPPKRTPSKTSE